MTNASKEIPCAPEGSSLPLNLRQRMEFDNSLAEGKVDLLHRLTKIGTALSAERNIDRLLEMILEEAKQLANADGGTLYLVSDTETELQFAIVQTSSLHVKRGGTAAKIDWPPVPLETPSGVPNHQHVCAHVAITGKTVNIEDVYQYEGFDFQGTRHFDRATGYRSRSMLVVPMLNHENTVIGVLQLLNAMEGDKIIPFSSMSLEITESFASQAAIAVSNKRLIQGLQDLLESFFRAIAVAIDEKSPYTSGHIRRVAELTARIADKINQTQEGPFADIHFSEDELEELQTAAWLHDVGKITTPEHVVDKETKLQTVFDRIEIVKLRLELYRTKLRLRELETRVGSSPSGESKDGKHHAEPETPPSQSGSVEKTLQDDLLFLEEINKGNEFVSDEKLARIREIASRTIEIHGEMNPLLLPDEVENLSVRRGTLTQAEREIVQNHAVMTGKILSQMPFPKKLKNVSRYAEAHHETLNGKGYPKGLTAQQIPLQARIIALADVFEALTASDRPYKKGNSLDQAMDILSRMAKEGHIDPDIFDLFRKEGLPQDYAQRELTAGQP